MDLFKFLIIVQAIIAAGLVGVILMQRSEGGGLGMGGGSPSGMMSARGAADFMTRLTTILATLFVAASIGLAFVSAQNNSGSSIDTSLERTELTVPTAGTENNDKNPTDNKEGEAAKEEAETAKDGTEVPTE